MLEKQIIINTIKEVIETENVEDSMNLFDYGLDSLGVLKLVTLLEDRLGIEIDDEDLTVENMSSVESIIDMVKKYEK